MKKTLMIAAAAAFMVSGIAATEATAGSYLKKCGSCHKADKDTTGPSFKSIQAAYGDSAKLAAAFAAGFGDDVRAVANTPGSKYDGKRSMMSSQYKKIAKDVGKGKVSYEELANLIFAE